MDDYIEREAFKSKYLCCGYLPEMSEEEFNDFPAADVAPVVRCRDCAHLFGTLCAVCGLLPRQPDDFCSRGERKDGGG